MIDQKSPIFQNFDKNPLESLVLAHNENVHSAMIAWLVRNLNEKSKIALLTPILGVESCGNEQIYAETEIKDIDILITVERGTEKQLYAIENKLKAAVHQYQNPTNNFPNQLMRNEHNVDQISEERGATVQGMTLLSYFAELPRSTAENSLKNWAFVTYETLCESLIAASIHDSSIYLTNYIDVIKRLIDAKSAIQNLEFTDIFEDKGSSPLALYASKGRLKVILQQIWLKQLAINLDLESSDWTLTFDSDHGHGLMNFAKIATIKGTEICWGIQLHQGNLKVFAHPNHYGKKATKTQHDAVEQALINGLRPRLVSADIGFGELSNTQDLGFRSFRIRKTADHPVPRKFGDYCDWTPVLAKVLRVLSDLTL